MSDVKNDKSKEVIRHAAVLTESGYPIFGKCHGDCFHKAYMLGIKLGKKADDQGFITNLGRFLNRYDSGELAFKNGQIEKATTMLFSEDLWDKEVYQGKFNHDEILGYIER